MSFELTNYLTAQHSTQKLDNLTLIFFLFVCFYFQKISEEERGVSNINSLLIFFPLFFFSSTIFHVLQFCLVR